MNFFGFILFGIHFMNLLVYIFHPVCEILCYSFFRYSFGPILLSPQFVGSFVFVLWIPESLFI